MKIKFSHDYPKLHGQKKATLLAVLKGESIKLDSDFIKYDTSFIREDGTQACYDLPAGLVLVLFFIGDKLIPFTTVRRWTEEKEKYYRANIGKNFEINITDTYA